MRFHELQTSLEALLEGILDEDLEGQKAARADWIKNKLGDRWRGLPGFRDINQFLDKLGATDPSPKGIYMPWIARLAITKPQENRTEDLDRLRDDLVNFERFKSRIERKDINQYKSFADLYDAVAPFLDREQGGEDFSGGKRDIITVYEGPEGWIRVPKTQEAAVLLGKGTRWCTAANKNNMFDHYAKDDNLFVVYDKETGARHQLHIDSGQFAAEDDRNKGLDAVPHWAGQKILDFYLKNNSQLTRKQISTLQKYSDRDLAKGTPHEALFDLFREYGIK